MKNMRPAKLLCFVSLLFFSFHLGAQEEPVRMELNFPKSKGRQVRYWPKGNAFHNEMGTSRFTRAIYGTNTGFRFETSDYPEFGLYMPNLGGSLYLALARNGQFKWVKEADRWESDFESGKRTYIIRDAAILGAGTLTVSALALSDADGLILSSKGHKLPSGVRLIWVFGGASDKRFSRSGDIGADPADCFYLEASKCAGNQYTLNENAFELKYGKAAKQLTGLFPKKASLRIGDANKLGNLTDLVRSQPSDRPVLLAEVPQSKEELFLEIHQLASRTPFKVDELSQAWTKADAYRSAIAGRIKVETPDPFINTLGGILSGGEDAIWESPSYLHGAIGWRMPLTGWRGSYIADVLGFHDRARTHFDGYARSQVTNRPVTLPHLQDTACNLSRAAKIWGTPMYSNGYISRYPNRDDVMNHYDMNVVYIDQLLWHLNWTGDWEYAKTIFPVIQRHLAWEKQTFDPDNDGLYDGYCCIWASDGLQYNGGVATHSTAYLYRANRLAADIAAHIGIDPEPYRREAELILNQLNKHLWIKDKGWWAEFKDNMGHGMRHEDAAVWTIYHAIDSEVGNPFQAWEATRYVDESIPHIPVWATNFPDWRNYVVSTTDWQPYEWSINNVAFAEIAHTALAFWQAGRPDEAFKLYKGALLDAMYMGSGPGNITQVSFYDAARGETYRDFADPLATCARSLVQGMFGIQPALLQDSLLIRPGIPTDWDHASLQTSDLTFEFKQEPRYDLYRIHSEFSKKPALTLDIPARSFEVERVLVNGTPHSFEVQKEAVGTPRILIRAGKADSYEIRIEWSGALVQADSAPNWKANVRFPEKKAPEIRVGRGDTVSLVVTGNVESLYDPQGVFEKVTRRDSMLKAVVAGQLGFRTIYLRLREGAMIWWKPVTVEVVEPVSVADESTSGSYLYRLKNQSLTGRTFRLLLDGVFQRDITLYPGQEKVFKPSGPVTMGTRRITLQSAEDTLTIDLTNWKQPNPQNARFEKVDLTTAFNDKVGSIFAYGKYLTPRWPYTTLQVPTQGMGEWCHPQDLSKIDDKGLRLLAGSIGEITMPGNVPFATPDAPEAKNVVFTTLWDNYPDSVVIPLQGKASKAYLLLAASTYHMQAYVLNGRIRAYYTDGTFDELKLILPDNLLPIDKELFNDGLAYRLKEPRPYRIRLKTGEISSNFYEDLHLNMSNEPLKVDGGFATMLDLPLNPQKELRSLTLETVANEVVIGLMGLTLLR